MIIDTSAIIAILWSKSEAAVYAEAIAKATARRLSVATFLEAAMVIDSSRGPAAGRRFDDLLCVAQITIEPVVEARVRVAREAYRDYGKGSGRPAQLNFGDCFAYALARVSSEPLLCKGDDFTRTDIERTLD